MNDSRALRVLGRDHANAILSGASSTASRKNSKTIPTGMRLKQLRRCLIDELLCVKFFSLY